MIALYTETFYEFLKRNEESDAWKVVKDKFARFPNFELDTTKISMYDLVVNKFYVREIGSETEDLFLHSISQKLDELQLKYIPKINMYLSNFKQALIDNKITVKRTIEESQDETSGTNASSSSDSKLYPITSIDSKNATGQSSTSSYTGEGQKTRSYAESEDSIMSKVYSKPQLLKQVFDIENVYLTCAEEFEDCFMGIF